MSKKVIIGMSGGVDSSVAAYLLKEQGYEVIGVCMQMLTGEQNDIEDARKVAQTIGIEFRVHSICEEFEKEIMDTFVAEYMKGRTPNPCCICNRQIKWKALLDIANEVEADYVATGHYARIVELANGRYTVCNSATATKDQTYVLCRLSQDQLIRTIMPIGEYEKEQVREIAGKIGIDVANKPDSQDICFIKNNDYSSFIKDKISEHVIGNFVDKEGNVLGEHKGIYGYTIGQRKGLGIALGKPAYVSEIRVDTNEVVIGDEDVIFTTTLTAQDINYMGADSIKEGDRFLGRIRYAHKGDMCTVTEISGDKISLEFDNPVRAITPGQSVVLYDGPYVMAAAVIC